MPERTYLAIDLKSFYASVECIERGLNPMTTNLVVADASRTEKTICLAVSPSLKSYGIPGRPRLFEVLQKVKEINLRRAQRAPGHRLTGSSSDNEQLKISPELGLDFIVAPPRMAHYMQVSTQIYDIYLKYIAPEDIHVYSIDEVLIDVTGYLQTYRLSAYDLAMKMILDVVRTTGITATAGIGPNLYLAKVALDIGAKHIQPDENGVRIACLDEMSYRRTLWTHRPLTDFWRVGRGYARKLEAHGMCTMGDIARCSIGKPSDYYNEDFLYKMFGVNAELLIDHAWGWEPCTIADIKAYKPESNSVGSGQVLSCPYSCQMARLVVHEMADSLALELVDQHLVTDQLVLTIGYDIENLKDPQRQHHSGAAEAEIPAGRPAPVPGYLHPSGPVGADGGPWPAPRHHLPGRADGLCRNGHRQPPDAACRPGRNGAVVAGRAVGPAAGVLFHLRGGLCRSVGPEFPVLFAAVAADGAAAGRTGAPLLIPFHIHAGRIFYSPGIFHKKDAESCICQVQKNSIYSPY